MSIHCRDLSTDELASVCEREVGDLLQPVLVVGGAVQLGVGPLPGDEEDAGERRSREAEQDRRESTSGQQPGWHRRRHEHGQRTDQAGHDRCQLEWGGWWGGGGWGWRRWWLQTQDGIDCWCWLCEQPKEDGMEEEKRKKEEEDQSIADRYGDPKIQARWSGEQAPSERGGGTSRRYRLKEWPKRTSSGFYGRKKIVSERSERLVKAVCEMFRRTPSNLHSTNHSQPSRHPLLHGSVEGYALRHDIYIICRSDRCNDQLSIDLKWSILDLPWQDKDINSRSSRL